MQYIYTNILNVRFKNWLIGIGIAILVLATSGAFFIRYIVANRFNELIQLLVSTETNNTYTFNSSKIKVSLLDKKISIKDATLNCTDTLNQPAYYNIKFKSLYFSVHSLREILVDKKLTIDSLALSQPTFYFFNKERSLRESEHNFHFSDLSRIMEKALTFLQVRAFSIRDGELEVGDAHHPGKIHGQGIDLHITNFSRKKDTDKHFLFSDEVELSIKRQELLLPSGLYEIAFNELHFSGKNEFFQLDSFSIVSTDANPSRLSISSHDIYFKSADLTSIYEKEEITVDSLIIVNPNLVIENKKQSADTLNVIHETTKELISGLKLKYVDIRGGRFTLLENESGKEIYSTDIMKMQLENIELSRETKNITAGSIRLDQRNISFMTRDSLFQLNVEEFSFINNELLLKNSSYKPTAYNTQQKRLSFTTPLLRLSKISIEDLILKRLKAKRAVLLTPDISITTGPDKKEMATSAAASKNEKTRRSNLFYKTLNDMHEIIQVDSLQIHDGRVRLKSADEKTLLIDMSGVSSQVLLNKFFMSDSMIDIKRSLPELYVNQIDFRTNKIAVDIKNYVFNGSTRYNHADHFKVNLSSNTTIEGEGINWEILDLDLLEKENIIQVDHIQAKDIYVVKGEKEQGTEKKELPVIRVGRIDINNVYYKDHPQSPFINIKGKDFCMDEVRSVDHFIVWNNLEGKIDGLSLSLNNFDIKTGEIIINNYYQHQVSNIDIQSSTATLKIPELIVREKITSTDFSMIGFKLATFKKGILQYQNMGLNVTVPDITATIKDASLYKGLRQRTWFEAAVNIDFQKAAIQQQFGDSTILHVNDVDVSFKDNYFSLQKINPALLINHSAIEKGTINYTGKKTATIVQNIQWDPYKKLLQLKDFSVTPNESMEDVFKKSNYQVEYIDVKGKSIAFHNLNIADVLQKSGEAKADKIILNEAELNSTKDKRLPLLRNRTKPMATEMVNKIKWPFSADTIAVANSHITVNEISAATNQKAVIPLKEVNAIVTNVSNKKENQDSIYLKGSFKLFNAHARDIQYAESYQDSLSSFNMHLRASPFKLEEFSVIIRPLLSASVVSGKADSIYAYWTGNKDAASGTMHFNYEGLKIRLINKKDPEKRGLKLKIENMLANAVIKNKNKTASPIFFERDKNKSIFNYWVKTKLSGIISSVVNSKEKSNNKNKKSNNKYQIILNGKEK